MVKLNIKSLSYQISHLSQLSYHPPSYIYMQSLGAFFTCVDFCIDKEAGNHADPDNCYGFIMCDVAGNAHEMDCPAGLAFNPSLLVCDWPENVECEAGSGELS